MFQFFKKNKNADIVVKSDDYISYFKISLNEYKKRISSLTPAEYKVYNEIVQGYSIENTSKKTKLKPNTIKSYQKSIYKKLNVHSKVELITTYANLYNYLNNVDTNLTVNDLKN